MHSAFTEALREFSTDFQPKNIFMLTKTVNFDYSIGLENIDKWSCQKRMCCEFPTMFPSAFDNLTSVKDAPYTRKHGTCAHLYRAFISTLDLYGENPCQTNLLYSESEKSSFFRPCVVYAFVIYTYIRTYTCANEPNVDCTFFV